MAGIFVIVENGKSMKKKENEEKLTVPCEVYSRVVGYYRPVQSWNIGKQEEYKDRKPFKV